MDTRLDTVRVELYNTYDDWVRLFMEIVLNLMVFGMFLFSCYQVGAQGSVDLDPSLDIDLDPSDQPILLPSCCSAD